MINRSLAPKINKVTSVNLILPRKHILSNSIPVWEIKTDKQDVIKLDLFFRAGRPFEQKQMIARACTRLLREGTSSYSSKEISEMLDFHGASLSSPVDLDNSNIVLYCLAKHFEKLLPLFFEIVTAPTFPQEELDQFIETNKQALKVNENKIDVKAYRTITEKIFGKDHPYGYNSSIEGLEGLNVEDIKTHFSRSHVGQNAELIVSGNTSKKTLALLDEYLGKIPIGEKSKIPFNFPDPEPKQVRLNMPNVLQSAIRIGIKTFKRSHPDYNGLYVLNTILGGYFGSRLMMNIREEKGYTYNIFSSLDTMVNDGYFYIGTEVGKAYEQQTLNEIYAETERLKNEPISKNELEMVKNYLMGNLLTMFDGPLNVSEAIKTMRVHDLPFDTLNELILTIQQITPKRIQELSNKYLNRQNFWEVVIGN